MTPPVPCALEMRGIHKRFGTTQALSGVDLRVSEGEVHALIGENGAGKSTLMKVLAGTCRADTGSMSLAGEPYAPTGPLDARARGVAMMYQELSLSLHLTVAQNVLLGREPQRYGLVDQRAQRERVEAALSVIEQPELHPNRKVGELSPGARQMVELTRALAFDARVVVMDEPTSSLSRREAERLFAVIDRLRARGVAVIYISHFLEEARRLAQRFTVLRDGKSVDQGTVPPTNEPDAGFEARVLTAMAGRNLGEAYPRVPHTRGEPILELEALSGLRLPIGVNLTLHRGEILGIAGLVGAGRTELVRALFGLDAVKSGRVRVGGQWDAGEPPFSRLAQGLGMLSENRKDEGLCLGLSIATNMTLSRPVARAGVVSHRAHAEATRRLGERLSLRYRDPEQAVSELSGGNQQKVAFARLLHHDVDVLLLDEPTRGIDVGSKAEIYRVMGELSAQGKAVLFVSSYLPELLGVCDRIAVMSRGRLSPARDVRDWNERTLLEAATGANLA